MPILGGQVHRRHLIDQFIVTLAVLPKSRMVAFDLETLCQLCQFGGAHLRAILPHDLAAQAAFFQPCQTARSTVCFRGRCAPTHRSFFFCHKVDVFGGGKFGSTDEVPLVFTVGVIRYRNDFPLLQVLPKLRE